ncbi:hypothetical protein [Defluviimonas sp. SAOS-178_SWC]|uniref:hypothetical protein n=1 Tax=Defluviimonas sp. SAOS-178_SWC TaxID=3121287 RepID=UPI0032215C0A
MKAQTPPKFLAHRSYRRRRMIDAARLLPLLGLFLILLPILWRPAATPEPDTAPGGVYLFAVWLFLIAVAFVLARRLSSAARDEGAADGAPDDGAR